jgi:predicted nuclease of predicted toxin-antitoxin system
MKFLADMGISPKTVRFLRDLGHEAVHLHEEGLDRLEDAAILTKAREENRILLTHDLDFGELIAASGARLPSVIVFRLRNMNPENVNRHLQSIIEHHQETLAEGAIISVTEGRIRVRPLPLQDG